MGFLNFVCEKHICTLSNSGFKLALVIFVIAFTAGVTESHQPTAKDKSKVLKQGWESLVINEQNNETNAEVELFSLKCSEIK